MRPRPNGAPSMCVLSSGQPPVSRAASLPGPARLPSARGALAGAPVPRIAAARHVSRPFVYRQPRRARRAPHGAFAPPPAGPPPSPGWSGPPSAWPSPATAPRAASPGRPVAPSTMRCPPAPPTTPRVRRSLPHGASTANGASPLSAPVPLAGACAHPAYCCLLSRGEHRDGDTWGARLPELADRGLAPRAGIAGSAGGPREGQHEAPPGAPCRGDVSRAPRGRQARGRHLDNRACGAVSRRVGPERRRARLAWREGRKGRSPALGLARATRAGPHAAALADEARALLGWSRRGALAVAGPRPRHAAGAVRPGRRTAAPARGPPRAADRPRPPPAGQPARRAAGVCRATGPGRGPAGLAAASVRAVGARGVGGRADGRSQAEALAAREGVAAPIGGRVRAVAAGGGGAGGGGGACEQRDREPQQPAEGLPLLARAAGAGLPGAVAVPPQPSAFPQERARATRGQGPARTAGGGAARALVGAAGPPALPPPLRARPERRGRARQRAGTLSARPGVSARARCNLKRAWFEPCPDLLQSLYGSRRRLANRVVHPHLSQPGGIYLTTAQLPCDPSRNLASSATTRPASSTDSDATREET